MKKRKRVGLDDVGSSQSRNSHRTESSSSSTGDEWLCASTRVPLPGETFNLLSTKTKQKPVSAVPLRDVKVAPRRFSAPNPSFTLGKDDHRKDGSESLSDTCTPTGSTSGFSPSCIFQAKKPSKLIQLKRASLSSPSASSPRIRKASPILTPEASSKWPSFVSRKRKNVVLELSPRSAKSYTKLERSVISRNNMSEDSMEVEESPLKTDTIRPAERTPSPAPCTSVESLMTDSQNFTGTIKTRGLENSRKDVLYRIATKREETWPMFLRSPIKTSGDNERSTSVVTQTILDSSPDEKNEGPKGGAIEPALSSVDTKSSASGDVIAATQELVTESDDETDLRSERFYIDEISRLNSNNPSTEKRMKEEEDSEEDESSSDEDDTLTRSSVARMNLTGFAHDLAEFILARRSERLMIKRDPNVQTTTYEVLHTVSAWGLSVSWLSPKAMMFAPPFARDPTTVTLALPLLIIPNKYDPEMPLILNPIIVSTTQDTLVANPET
ncbi:hypothetical protein RB195_005342 [Necator americanus]|uniref:Uncharacterized protein n=1 Tax=Necator americanus TaxID=51031 RepID=A0ABR1BQC0_NECAM